MTNYTPAYDSPETRDAVQQEITNQKENLNPFANLQTPEDRFEDDSDRIEDLTPQFILDVVEDHLEEPGIEIDVNNYIDFISSKYNVLLRNQGSEGLALNILVNIIKTTDIRKHSLLVDLVASFIDLEIYGGESIYSQELELLSKIIEKSYLIETKNLQNVRKLSNIIEDKTQDLFTILLRLENETTENHVKSVINHLLFLKFFVLPNFRDKDNE